MHIINYNSTGESSFKIYITTNSSYIIFNNTKLKRSRAVDMKQEIIKSSESSESSRSTDPSNYASDEKTDKVIIHNYDEKEPESKLIIKKVRRKNKINHEELKKIYDEFVVIYILNELSPVEL